MRERTPDRALTEQRELRETAESYVIPLAAEELEVGRREVVTGRVRIRTAVESREELVDEPLSREVVEVERREIGRLVDAGEESPRVREEGDLIIVPVLEEVLVVEKRLRLKEELVLRRVRTEERHQEAVTLRREVAVVERVPVPVASDDTETAAATRS